jgi:hypothetical protein
VCSNGARYNFEANPPIYRSSGVAAKIDLDVKKFFLENRYIRAYLKLIKTATNRYTSFKKCSGYVAELLHTATYHIPLHRYNTIFAPFHSGRAIPNESLLKNPRAYIRESFGGEK